MAAPDPRHNVRTLAICQGLYTAAISIDLTLTGLAGYVLAEDKRLATLPFSIIIVTAALTALVAASLLKKLGRRRGFTIGATAGMLGGLVSALAMFRHDFVLFCVGTAGIGVFQAFAQYYRLAAADESTGDAKARAIATVMTGGVLAALFGPLLARSAQDWFAAVPFAGAYLLAAALGLASLLLLLRYRESRHDTAEAVTCEAPRPLSLIVAQPVFIAAIANNLIAYAVMVCLMTATPLAMLACGFNVADGAGVIQWHMLGMFAPAFVSGRLIGRFGVLPVSLSGALLLAASAVLGQASTALPAFYVALMLLGVGWNFMFVAGTTLLAQSYRPNERARTQGGSEFATSCAAALGSFIAAPWLQRYGWSALNAAVLPLLIVPVLATLYWRFAPRPAVATA
ncbi:MFS transporter [Jeongeupia naejangsanensis]|uniref:MFS transporter n=1 Tax=Jeongeupia naejangsanensis TaxID=613195 RepID=A0ABS2BLV4_9NEIS|nr:MFS transporter [Jeongeupia naejangsanensis]MBM3116589.1 MFS transporter [Jeongeupia naejangsanensis]